MKRDSIFDHEEQAREQARAEIERQAAEELRKTREEEQASSERAINGSVDEVHRYARRAARFSQLKRDVIGRLKKMIRANPDLDTGDPIKTVSNLSVVLFGWLGAYLFDFFLLGILSSYWLNMQSANALIRTIAKFVIPLAFLFLEIALATLLVNAYKRGKRLVQSLWAAFSTLIIIGVAWFTASMVMASEDVDVLGDLGIGGMGLLLFMVLIAVMPHVVLLFGGLLGYEGKALLLVFGRRFRARRYDKKYEKAADTALSHFRLFVRKTEEHRRRFPGTEWVLSETFSAEAREIINDRMGYRVIPSRDDFDPPDGPEAAPAEMANVPPGTPVNGVPAFARQS